MSASVQGFAQAASDEMAQRLGVQMPKAKAPAEERRLRTVTLDECEERGPAWLVQNLIEQATVAAVTGEPGSAKTFLLIDLALHVAAGKTWFGRKVQQGAVIYVAAEAASSVRRRAALAHRVKFLEKQPPPQPPPPPLPLRIVTEPALLGDERQSVRDRVALEKLIDDVAAEFREPVVLLIVDTIAASMGNGNENLDGMQRLVAAANLIAATTDITVLLNHHPNTSGGTLRGHSSLRGTVSHGFQIEVKGEVRVVNAFKQRDAAAGRLFAYRLDVHELGEKDNFGDPATSCVVQTADIPETDTRDDHEQTRLTLAVVEVLARGNGCPVRFGDILDAAQGACGFLQGKTEEATRKAVSRALRALTEAGVASRCEAPRGHYRLAQQ